MYFVEFAQEEYERANAPSLMPCARRGKTSFAYYSDDCLCVPFGVRAAMDSDRRGSVRQSDMGTSNRRNGGCHRHQPYFIIPALFVLVSVWRNAA